MTEEKALSRLASLCAKAEYSTGDMEDKMRRWGLSDDAIERNIDYLVSHKYVDNERYCKAFIDDKITFNHWGRRKIEQALWQKRVPKDVSAPILDKVPEEKYLEVLKPMLKDKWPTINAETDYERSMKLIKWAMGRGFDIETIKRALGSAEIDDD